MVRQKRNECAGWLDIRRGGVLDGSTEDVRECWMVGQKTCGSDGWLDRSGMDVLDGWIEEP